MYAIFNRSPKYSLYQYLTKKVHFFCLLYSKIRLFYENLVYDTFYKI